MPAQQGRGLIATTPEFSGAAGTMRTLRDEYERSSKLPLAAAFPAAIRARVATLATRREVRADALVWLCAARGIRELSEGEHAAAWTGIGR